MLFLSGRLSVWWEDSFEFSLQAHDLPDSGCIPPHFKALLGFGHWMLTPASACCSLFLLLHCDKLLIRSFSSQNMGFVFEGCFPIDTACWCRSGPELASASFRLSMTVDSLIGACYVANGFL